MDTRFETKEATIDGLRVLSTPITPLRAFALLSKLGKHVTPLLKALSGNFAKAGSSGKTGASFWAMMMGSDVDRVAAAVQEAFSTLASGEAEQLVRDILISTTVIDGDEKLELARDQAITKAFTGRVMTMFRCMKFALEVTFSDFSSAVSALSLAGKAGTANPSS